MDDMINIVDTVYARYSESFMCSDDTEIIADSEWNPVTWDSFPKYEWHIEHYFTQHEDYLFFIS